MRQVYELKKDLWQCYASNCGGLMIQITKQTKRSTAELRVKTGHGITYISNYRFEMKFNHF
ncbi:hypothetical protein [Bacillus wiedmannii]|uniref:hypothetical protein n=1 Tax=Bacillus wiedmannii TaxID=1890302 RepID=UPI0030EEB852